MDSSIYASIYDGFIWISFIYLRIYLRWIYMDIYSFTHLPTYLSTHLSTHLPTYPSIHLSTYLPIYLPTHLPPCGFNLLILGVHIRSCRINKVPLTERANYTKLKLPEIAASPLGFFIFLSFFS
jgi:hypothetical protein